MKTTNGQETTKPGSITTNGKIVKTRIDSSTAKPTKKDETIAPKKYEKVYIESGGVKNVSNKIVKTKIEKVEVVPDTIGSTKKVPKVVKTSIETG